MWINLCVVIGVDVFVRTSPFCANNAIRGAIKGPLTKLKNPQNWNSPPFFSLISYFELKRLINGSLV